MATKTREIKPDYVIVNNDNNAVKQCFFVLNKQHKILCKALKESLKKEKTFPMN